LVFPNIFFFLSASGSANFHKEAADRAKDAGEWRCGHCVRHWLPGRLPARHHLAEPQRQEDEGEQPHQVHLEPRGSAQLVRRSAGAQG